MEEFLEISSGSNPHELLSCQNNSSFSSTEWSQTPTLKPLNFQVQNENEQNCSKNRDRVLKNTSPMLKNLEKMLKAGNKVFHIQVKVPGQPDSNQI